MKPCDATWHRNLRTDEILLEAMPAPEINEIRRKNSHDSNVRAGLHKYLYSPLKDHPAAEIKKLLRPGSSHPGSASRRHYHNKILPLHKHFIIFAKIIRVSEK